MKNCKTNDTPIAKGQYVSCNINPKTPEEKKKMARVPSAYQ